MVKFVPAFLRDHYLPFSYIQMFYYCGFVGHFIFGKFTILWCQCMLFQELNISIRSSNPVVPSGRRSKLCWTEEEAAALKVIILGCKFSLPNPCIIS